jgi:hypothetical protein
MTRYSAEEKAAHLEQWKASSKDFWFTLKKPLADFVLA